VPEAGRFKEQVESQGRASTHVLFLGEAELGLFHFLEKVTGWLVPSAGQKVPVQPGTFHCRRSGTSPKRKAPLSYGGN